METPEQKELEKFIHQQLRKLPEREAPEDIVSNVLAAISERENLPWWKQPFTSWPRNTQVILYTLLSAAFVAIVYFAWRPVEVLGAQSLTERVSSFAWLGRTLDTLAGSALLVIRGLPWQFLVAIAVVFTLVYLACVATGFALYRLTARQSAMNG